MNLVWKEVVSSEVAFDLIIIATHSYYSWFKDSSRLRQLAFFENKDKQNRSNQNVYPYNAYIFQIKP